MMQKPQEEPKRPFKNSTNNSLNQSSAKKTMKKQNSHALLSTKGLKSEKKKRTASSSSKHTKPAVTHSQPKQSRQASARKNQPCIYQAKFNPVIEQPLCKGVPADVAETDRMLLIGPQNQRDKGKKTLVLDLDETLVHSSFQPIPQVDIHLNVEIDGQNMPVYVQKRPFCEEFIKHMAPHYEIVMFTASLEKYANPLYSQIDKQTKTEYSLYRESCTFWNGIFVKDLTRLGRDMKDVIIVDNSPAAYLFQPENALPCQSWYSDKSDTELLQMVPLLQKLSQVDDVRDKLKLFVKDAKINFEKANKILQEEIIAQKTKRIREGLNPEILMTPPANNKKKNFESDIKPKYESGKIQTQMSDDTPMLTDRIQKSDFSQTQKFNLLQPVLQQKQETFATKKSSIESNSKEAFSYYGSRTQAHQDIARRSQDVSKSSQNSKSFLKPQENTKSHTSYVTPQAQEIVKKALNNNYMSHFQQEKQQDQNQVKNSLEGFKNQRMIYQQQAMAIDEMKRKALIQNKLLTSAQKENKFSPRKRTHLSALKPKSNNSSSSQAFNQIDSNIQQEQNKRPLSSKKQQTPQKDNSLKAHYSLQDKKYQEYIKSLQKQQQQRKNSQSSAQKGLHSKTGSLADSQDTTQIGSQKKITRVQSAKNMKTPSKTGKYLTQKSPREAPCITTTAAAPCLTKSSNTFSLKQLDLGVKKEERQQNFNVFLKDLQQKRQTNKEKLENQFGYSPSALMTQSQKFTLSPTNTTQATSGQNTQRKFLSKVSTNVPSAPKALQRELLFRNQS